VVVTVEQCLEGHVTDQVLQELAKKEVEVKQQVEAAQVNIEAFEVVLPKSE
jgi:hypothetical protein